MRLAFIFMILANLVYFAWQYPRDGNADDLVIPLPPKTARSEHGIVLLHELEQLSRLEPAGPAAVVPAPPIAPPDAPVRESLAVARCYQVGPFASLGETEQAASRLQSYGVHAPGRRSTEEQDQLRYWVLYEAADKDVARRAYDSLRSQGMKDLFVMANQENTLSLGLFRGRNTARRRVEEVRAMGVAAEIREKYRTRTLYWLDVREPRDRALDDPAWADVLSGAAGALQTRVDCPRQ